MTPPPVTLPTSTPAESRALLGEMLRPHRRWALAAVVVLLASAAAGLVVPPVLGRIVDISLSGAGAALTASLVVLAAAVVAQGLLTGLGVVAVASAGERVLADLRERVLTRALAIPQERIEQSGTGDLVARVGNDVDVVSGAIRSAFPAFVLSLLTVVLTFVGLGALDPWLALAGAAAVPVQVVAARRYHRISPPLYAAERRAEADRSQQLIESISGTRVITAFLLGPRHLRRVAESSENARRAHIRATDAGAWFFTRVNAAELVGTASIVLVGTVLVGRGSITVGEATAAALYFLRLFDPIGTLLTLLDTAQSALASLNRLTGVAALPPPAHATVHPRPGVEVCDVRFGYGDGPDVLHGIDLHVAPGEHVALVGASGAGKSTLAAVVAGIHAPSTGRVHAHDVALITQEVHVFSGTLAADLRLADPAATDAELESALRTVGALAWVTALPDGLATRVGAGGVTLDPVRAQQLALARLVLRDPDVAILDEATAEAGSAGARILERTMAEALRGRTALVVAHRITAADRADRVVVLDAGRIVEQGRPVDLAAGDGPYARLRGAWSATRTSPPGAQET